MSSRITEINKDTFWELIAQAKEHPGGPSEWLMEQLMDLGPEQAKKCDDIASAYTSLANQYGLWAAASVMEHGCTDDGFIDFRTWLVAQGKDVYMAALKDPDSLADVPDYPNSLFDSLPRMGDSAYEELTGRSTYQDFDPDQYHALKEELKKDIVYGEGIGYPYFAISPGARCRSKDFYNVYERWCQDNLEKPLAAKTFLHYLKEHQQALGIIYDEKCVGTSRGFHNVCLTPFVPVNDDDPDLPWH